MRPFTTLTARAAPLDKPNVDTDQIIPKQFLKTLGREGLADGLFYDLRFDADGREKPDFVLNQPRYAGAGILIAGDNFGCGSSREHAAWAMVDFGLRCVIAPSFADIFHGNCFENGLLPITLGSEQVSALTDEAKGGNHVFFVDLAAQTVIAPSGAVFAFDIEPGCKQKLLQGLDSIGETLGQSAEIDAYERRAAAVMPWLEAP